GSVLFSAEASHLALNPAFQLKVALASAGLINVAIYVLWGRRAVARLAPGAAMPARAKIARMLSVTIWLAVAACGRSIAYFCKGKIVGLGEGEGHESSRAADSEAIHPQGRLADSDGHRLTVLAADANARIEFEVIADHADAVEVGRAIADQHR